MRKHDFKGMYTLAGEVILTERIFVSHANGICNKKKELTVQGADFSLLKFTFFQGACKNIRKISHVYQTNNLVHYEDVLLISLSSFNSWNGKT